MKYNETLALRVAERLMYLPDVEEKEMFSGLIFMVNGKMCIGVSKNSMMEEVASQVLFLLQRLFYQKVLYWKD